MPFCKTLIDVAHHTETRLRRQRRTIQNVPCDRRSLLATITGCSFCTRAIKSDLSTWQKRPTNTDAPEYSRPGQQLVLCIHFFAAALVCGRNVWHGRTPADTGRKAGSTGVREGWWREGRELTCGRNVCKVGA
jgi:hypothetical protein